MTVFKARCVHRYLRRIHYIVEYSVVVSKILRNTSEIPSYAQNIYMFARDNKFVLCFSFCCSRTVEYYLNKSFMKQRVVCLLSDHLTCWVLNKSVGIMQAAVSSALWFHLKPILCTHLVA